MGRVDFSRYDNSWYRPGRGSLVCILWYFVNFLVVKNRWIPGSQVKVWALRIFGAKIGKSVVIRPGVSVKYPWRLRVGDCSWIGENVWIDNLGEVTIGRNVCISQGAMLLCGNHNYKKPSFDLMVDGINLADGAWCGAQATVCPGVSFGKHAVLAVGAVATSDLDENGIYQGNPAKKIRERVIESE